MKSFSQFQEAAAEKVKPPKSFDKIGKEMGNIAQQFRMDKETGEKLAGGIAGTVINRLTGGEEGQRMAVDKITGTINTASAKLPDAVNNFNKFITSGKPQEGINQLQKELTKGISKVNQRKKYEA